MNVYGTLKLVYHKQIPQQHTNIEYIIHWLDLCTMFKYVGRTYLMDRINLLERVIESRASISLAVLSNIVRLPSAVKNQNLMLGSLFRKSHSMVPNQNYKRLEWFW